jgi:hypothetical protein
MDEDRRTPLRTGPALGRPSGRRSPTIEVGPPPPWYRSPWWLIARSPLAALAVYLLTSAMEDTFLPSSPLIKLCLGIAVFLLAYADVLLHWRPPGWLAALAIVLTAITFTAVSFVVRPPTVEQGPLSTPRFTPQVTHFLLMAPTNDPSDMELYVNMTIPNQGTPSIAMGYEMFVETPSGKRRLRSEPIPERIKTLNEEQEKVIQALKISPSTDLVVRTAVTIPQGGMTRGWLRYVARGAKRDDVKGPQVKRTVIVKDVFGKEYPVDVPDGEPMPIPGPNDNLELVCPGL